MAESLLESQGSIGRYVQWTINMLSSRRQQVARLTNLYGGNGGVQLFTPALVDFQYWLDEAPLSPFADQIAVMDVIQRRQTNDAMIHCFAPFDPWRQIVDEDQGHSPTALELVQQAVMESGFVGVKLYPPMGFFPADNSNKVLNVPERARDIPDFPKRLDQALDKLYAWCHQQDVAIMAHATDSNAGTQGAGKRASPRVWQPVLRAYPGLRLNLAHFGGFDEVFSGMPVTDTWEWAVGELLQENPAGLYADMSYLAEFLGDKTSKKDRAKIRQLLAQFVSEFDPGLRHLLYGSDWVMMGKEPDHKKYMLIQHNLLMHIGMNPQQQKNYFTNNAVNFLGLAPGQKPRARLEDYYRRYGLDRERLKIVAGA